MWPGYGQSFCNHFRSAGYCRPYLSIDCSNSGHYITLLGQYLNYSTSGPFFFPPVRSQPGLFDNPAIFQCIEMRSVRHVVLELIFLQCSTHTHTHTRASLRKCMKVVVSFIAFTPNRKANIVVLYGRKCFCASPLPNNTGNIFHYARPYDQHTQSLSKDYSGVYLIISKVPLIYSETMHQYTSSVRLDGIGNVYYYGVCVLVYVQLCL